MKKFFSVFNKIISSKWVFLFFALVLTGLGASHLSEGRIGLGIVALAIALLDYFIFYLKDTDKKMIMVGNDFVSISIKKDDK